MGNTNIQLKKGVIEILILKLLSREKMYGYQLLQELDKRSEGVFKMKEGTLYPVLYRLEDDGFITSLWEEPDPKSQDKRPMPRKYYQINANGRKELSSLILDLKTLTKAISLILEEDIKNG
jgi:PadR family transcriptional regulator, regulatory protein PadR